jgi:hypothetical protein
MLVSSALGDVGKVSDDNGGKFHADDDAHLRAAAICGRAEASEGVGRRTYASFLLRTRAAAIRRAHGATSGAADAALVLSTKLDMRMRCGQEHVPCGPGWRCGGIADKHYVRHSGLLYAYTRESVQYSPVRSLHNGEGDDGAEAKIHVE